MAEYNSAHTGPEIDAAVSAVKTKQSTWDNKQDKITGKAGQVVGFDASGNPIAQEAPSGGASSWNDLADKPFGETGTVILEEQTLVFNEEVGAFVAELSATLKVGDTISVSYNGTVYECVGANSPNPELPYVLFGNMSLLGGESDTGEPFGLLSVGTTAMIVNADMEAPVVKILFSCIEKLPKRYYDAQVIFYPGADKCLYTDEGRTTKAKMNDVQAAIKKHPILVCSDKECMYLQVVSIVPASLVESGASGLAVFAYYMTTCLCYHTAEYTGS